MAVEHDRFRTTGLRAVEAGLHVHRRAEAMRARRGDRNPAPAARLETESAASTWWRSRVGRALWWQITKRFAKPVLRVTQSRWMRRFGIGAAAAISIFVLVAGGLWLLLASGPISLDVATPWLAAAVAENFGNRFRVDIGGTVLERDEHGRMAVRIRSITVRDHDGAVVASAPKAEVGFSSTSLLNGRLRAQRLNLVGAEIEALGSQTAIQQARTGEPDFGLGSARDHCTVMVTHRNGADAHRHAAVLVAFQYGAADVDAEPVAEIFRHRSRQPRRGDVERYWPTRQHQPQPGGYQHENCCGRPHADAEPTHPSGLRRPRYRPSESLGYLPPKRPADAPVPPSRRRR